MSQCNWICHQLVPIATIHIKDATIGAIILYPTTADCHRRPPNPISYAQSTRLLTLYRLSRTPSKNTPVRRCIRSRNRDTVLVMGAGGSSRPLWKQLREPCHAVTQTQGDREVEIGTKERHSRTTLIERSRLLRRRSSPPSFSPLILRWTRLYV